MSEFETLLEKHRTLAVQLDDQRGYLKFLKEQMDDVERRLKEIGARAEAASSEVAEPKFAAFWLPPGSVPATASMIFGESNETPSPITSAPEVSLSALEETAKGVSELGESVSAERLAEHLKISRDAARLRLQRAAKIGVIIRIAQGRYRAIKRVPKNSGVHRIENSENTTGQAGPEKAA
jgi:biotin operon repressor